MNAVRYPDAEIAGQARPAGFSDSSSDEDGDYEISGNTFESRRNPANHHLNNNVSNSHSLNNGFKEHEGSSNAFTPYEESWEDQSMKQTYTTPKPEELLRIACCEGDLDFIKKYVEENPDKVNFWMDNLTPLMYGAKHAQASVVAYLLSLNADANLHKKNRITALMYAVTSPKKSEDEVLEVVKLLITTGKAKINDKDLYGITPLGLAVKEDRAKVVKLLLDYEADPNIEDSAGKTCLFYAADQGNGRIVRLLLENNADPSVHDYNGYTAVEIAGDKNFFKLSELIQIVRDTKWKPGLHTSLMKEIDYEAVTKRRQDYNESLGTKEDQCIDAILTTINASHYAQAFKEHRITYLQFVQLDDERLEKIGIKEVGIREELLKLILDIQNASWQESSLPPLPSKTGVGMSDAVCMTDNVNNHLKHIAASINTMKKKIEKDPKALQLGSYKNKILDLISRCQQITESNILIYKETKALKDVLLDLEGRVQYLPGDEVKSVSSKNGSIRETLYTLFVGASACFVGVGVGVGSAFYLFRKFK